MTEATNNVFETPKQPENDGPVQCDICNITCNKKDLLEKHKKGKKHSKYLQNLADSSANAPNKVSVPPPIASETSAGESENKKQGLLQHGATTESIYCDVCDVVCYTLEIYQKHVTGKKHSAKMIIQMAANSGFLNAISCSTGGYQKKPETFQCELCKITCTSRELLNMHLAGKKHFKKLQVSGQIPNLPLTAATTPAVNPESSEGKIVNESDGSERKGKRSGSVEDVESKKQKVLQGGAPLNAIRTCTLCNVVCNSPKVFTAHLDGQKHAAAMAVKQAETQELVKKLEAASQGVIL